MTMTAANDEVCDIATYQRWTPTIAAEPLRGGIAGGLPLECPTESFVQTTDRSWKNSQARPRRLRPQAPNLRQYGRCPRDPLEVRGSNHLMVAQHEGSNHNHAPPQSLT